MSTASGTWQLTPAQFAQAADDINAVGGHINGDKGSEHVDWTTINYSYDDSHTLTVTASGMFAGTAIGKIADEVAKVGGTQTC